MFTGVVGPKPRSGGETIDGREQAMDSYAYRVKAAEPCIQTEIFLAKRAELQGALYQTLTAGFRLGHLRDHFLQADDAKKKRIRAFLSRGWTFHRPEYTAEEIAEFPRLFYGYSLYEVDGVFLKDRSPAPHEGDHDENYEIEEERAQVIRIIFRYDCADRSAKVIDFLKASLRDPLSEIGGLADNYPELRPRIDAEVAAELQALDRWVRYAGLFVFGYLVFEICDTILRSDVVRYGQRDFAEIRQDEIWVSSLWNLNMNVVQWTGEPSD